MHSGELLTSCDLEGVIETVILIIRQFSAIASGVTAGLAFEADKPNPTPCLADCAWAIPCKNCDSCFQDPANWINPSDECKGTESLLI